MGQTDLLNSDEWKKLKATSAKVQKLVLDQRHLFAHTEANANIDDKTKREHIEGLRKETKTKLATLQKEVQDAEKVLNARFHVALAPEPKGDMAQLLYESKVSRAVPRVKALIDRAGTGTEKQKALTDEIERAVKNGERHTIDAIAESADAWFTNEELPLINQTLDHAKTRFYTNAQKETARQKKLLDDPKGVLARAKIALAQGESLLDLPLSREGVLVGTDDEVSILTIEPQPAVKPQGLPGYTEDRSAALAQQPVGSTT